ncbi:hypothetical protein [Nocardia huaxiensis]|uniref:Uncharacterized protein n=1 Tax=Nocardia huaxiensis TaxID=2755382 RepID=A0A7D6ZB40_9NOCA|nr:hypothetical protein [Nocardia huaxiensis]QLY29458.1 hypothetical protein H0264_30010 [Nocardia huaxiensis]UFS96989.1 hypothetical protein LPY97_03375 [Nocardia huaxiensis]
MAGFFRLGVDLLIGDLKWFAIGGFVLLVLAAVLWDAVSVAVGWVMGFFRTGHRFDEEREQSPRSRRTTRTRERRAALEAERRAALRAKYADSSPVHADRID